ncbi:two-component regulator propeller domain-containing protein [Algivirga pacifica]|uniref:PPM-type phosphatase domain-containing protein n=1 Tax=Algivirga pacifica TaxID=1162670 RepID=A0ABP9D5G1_9BACT
MRIFFLKTIIALLFLYPTSRGFAQLHSWQFEQITNEEGLTNNHVSDLLLDSIGFLWVGTHEGLLRYEGNHFKTFTHSPDDSLSIPSNRVLDMYPAKDGRVLLTLEGGGLCYYDPVHMSFHPFDQHYFLDTDRINGTFMDSKKRLWVGSYGGIYLVQNMEDQLISRSFSESHKNLLGSDVRAMVEDSAGRIWIGTTKGLMQYNEETRYFDQFLSEDNGLPSDHVLSLGLSRDGTQLWVGTQGGLSVLNFSNEEVKTYHWTQATRKGASVWSIYEDTEGNVWAGGQEELRVKLKGENTFTPIPQVQSAVYNIVEDRSGRLWFGTVAEGLYYTDPYISRFEYYSAKASYKGALSNDLALSFFENETGDIWVGTDGGGLNHLSKEGRITPLRGANFLDDQAILSSYYDGNGKVWLGTYAKGLFYMDLKTGVEKHYEHKKGEPNSLPSNDVRAIFKDHDGTLWIGTNNGGVSHFDPQTEQFTNYTGGEGDKYLPNNSASCIMRDQKGRLWVGTYYGLALLEDAKEGIFKHFFPNVDLQTDNLSNMISSVYEDSKGRLWLSTYGGGLLLFDITKGAFVKKYTVEDGLSSNNTYGVLEDKDGNLWVSTAYGISKFIPEEEKFIVYTEKDGLITNEFLYGAYMKSKSGKLYFGGVGGFNTFYTSWLIEDKTTPKVVLTGLRVFHEEVKVGAEDHILSKSMPYLKELTLTAEQSSFSIDFAALSYIYPQKNTYKYMLEGFDEEWLTASDIARADYTNVPWGTYTFRVKAANWNGVWNEEGAQLKVVVLPAWWETIWFRLLVILTAVSVIYGVYLWRIRILRMKEAALEQAVDERTLLLADQAARLDEQNVTLDSQTKELQDQATILEEHKQELAAQKDSLEEQNKVLEKAHKRIDVQNTWIVSSLNYAQTIQETILPKKEQLQVFFEEVAVFYRPKDIVSGDFYWGAIKGEQLYFAFADCTGHGVPGAIMSMLGANALNKLINDRNLTDPKEILLKLNEEIQRVLRQPDSGNTDGMDICFCIYEFTAYGGVLTYAGGKMPLYHYNAQEGKLVRLQTASRSIGGRQKEKPFSMEKLEVKKGDILYFSTDGFIDQVGEETGKRVGTPRFMDLLREHVDLSLTEQSKQLEEFIKTYQGNEVQRDDITVVGLKV